MEPWFDAQRFDLVHRALEPLLRESGPDGFVSASHYELRAWTLRERTETGAVVREG